MTDGMTVAAVDIGGTKTAAALVRGGAVLCRTETATPARDGPDAVLDLATALVRELPGTPERFGAGVAGVVDGGVVRAATNAIAGWAGTDVRVGLATRLGVDGMVCNDVHGFVLGETAYGAATGATDVIGVTVGTGIGGGVIAGGRLLIGAHGAAAHLGHLAVPQAEGLPCPCGASGHLEAVASGPAVAAAYASQGPASLPDVVAAARSGDRFAAGLLDTAGAALGTALGSLVNVFDPEVVVIGGGAAVPEIVAAARRELARTAMPALHGVPVKTAGLGADAVLVGAAALAVTA